MSLFGSLQNILMLRKMPTLSFPVFAIALSPPPLPAIDSATIAHFEQYFLLHLVSILVNSPRETCCQGEQKLLESRSWEQSQKKLSSLPAVFEGVFRTLWI